MEGPAIAVCQTAPPVGCAAAAPLGTRLPPRCRAAVGGGGLTTLLPASDAAALVAALPAAAAATLCGLLVAHLVCTATDSMRAEPAATTSCLLVHDRALVASRSARAAAVWWLNGVALVAALAEATPRMGLSLSPQLGGGSGGGDGSGDGGDGSGCDGGGGGRVGEGGKGGHEGVAPRQADQDGPTNGWVTPPWAVHVWSPVALSMERCVAGTARYVTVGVCRG